MDITERIHMPWRTKENEFLRKNYPEHGAKWCAKRLQRKAAAVRNQAMKLRIRYKQPSHRHDRAIRGMHQKQKTVAEMAEKLEVPKYIIRRAHRRMNLKPFYHKPADWLRRDVLELHREGWTDKEIAAKVCRSWSLIRTYRFRMGLKPNQRPKAKAEPKKVGRVKLKKHLSPYGRVNFRERWVLD